MAPSFLRPPAVAASTGKLPARIYSWRPAFCSFNLVGASFAAEFFLPASFLFAVAWRVMLRAGSSRCCCFGVGPSKRVLAFCWSLVVAATARALHAGASMPCWSAVYIQHHALNRWSACETRRQTTTAGAVLAAARQELRCRSSCASAALSALALRAWRGSRIRTAWYAAGCRAVGDAIQRLLDAGSECCSVL